MTGRISEAPAAGIGKLLMDNRFFVPSHQRDYEWPEPQVGQLLDDVEGALARPDPFYFHGLMVFLSSESGDLVVLDGQQRLATAVLVFSAIRNWLQQYSEHRQDAGKIQDWFIGRSELGEKSLHPRLTMNIANSSAFNDYVIKSVPLNDIKRALSLLKRHDPNRELLAANVYVHERIANMAERAGAPHVAAKYFFLFAAFLRDQVSVVKLTVDSEEVAFTIFETLNDRGLDLSPLDLIKNHLFRQAASASPARLKEMENRWSQMMYTLSNVKADSFLRAFWTSRHGRVRSTNIFQAFKNAHTTTESTVELSIDMLRTSEQYAALDSHEDPWWATYSSEARRSIRALKLLGSQQIHPALLAAMEKMEPRELERLLRMFEVITVRYLLIGGGHTGRLETSCAILARRIFQGEIKTATEAFLELQEFYPSDDDFKQEFREKQERQNAKIQYLLRTLEIEQRRIDLAAMAGELEPGTLTVEHILPKNPGEEWKEIIENDPGIIEECTFLLGNVCLLTDVNRELGRIGFEKKKAVYADSELRLTNQLADADGWNRKSIIHRQARMAKLAAQAWRFQ